MKTTFSGKPQTPSGRGRNRAETGFEISKHATRLWMQTPLGKSLIRAGTTPAAIARLAGVGLPDVSNFILGRRHVIGRRRRKAIRLALIKSGAINIKQRPRCTCPVCGREHSCRHLNCEGIGIRNITRERHTGSLSFNGKRFRHAGLKNLFAVRCVQVADGSVNVYTTASGKFLCNLFPITNSQHP